MPIMVLSALERRVLSHLSIPRNAEDLSKCVAKYTPASAEQIDALLKGDLGDQGWVVKLGEHDDPAKLASAVQKNKQAMDLPDDKADIYTRRMSRDDLSWRMGGDLWMLTNDGLAELHAPLPDAPEPMTPSRVQAAVDAEWARTHKGPIERDSEGRLKVELASRLLEHEFLDWYDKVADDCERRWGKNNRPKAPLAGGASGYSDAYEVALIDAENQKTALGAVVDPWYMALSILAFTDADTGTTADNGTHIPTYTGYARKSVAGTDMPAATSGAGSAANTSAIIFAACTAGTSTILAAANTSASTVGTLRKWGDVASTVVSTTATPPQFGIGAWVTSTA